MRPKLFQPPTALVITTCDQSDQAAKLNGGERKILSAIHNPAQHLRARLREAVRKVKTPLKRRKSRGNSGPALFGGELGLGGRGGAFRRGRRRIDGVAAGPPCIQPAFEGPDAFDPVLSQEERHPGARGLVRSSAVENHVPVARNLLVALHDLTGKHVDGALDHARVGLEIERTP